MRHILIILFIFLISLTIISCAKKSSDDSASTSSDNTTTTSSDDTTTTDTTAPTVTSVSTAADDQSSVALTDNITVTFSEAMDTTTVTTNISNTTCSGTLRVSSDNFSSCVQMSSEPASSNDNKTFTLDPSDNLTGGTTYLTRVTTGVKDAAGNEMSSQYETSTGFTTMPDYETTTLSGTIAGTAWTFYKGQVKVPTSSSGLYWYRWTSDNISNACSSTYTGTSSNPFILDSSVDAPAVGEEELCFASGCSTNTVTFYDGSTNYIIYTGKIKIDNVTTTEVTGKMYAKGSDSDNEINGTFTLSRCCLSSGSYSVCSE